MGLAEAFLQDQPDTEPERTGSHHGQVIDRAVYRQTADGAAREEDRIDYEAIGCVGQAAGYRIKQGGVILAGRSCSAQGGNNQLVQQLVGKASATAVAEKNKVA